MDRVIALSSISSVLVPSWTYLLSILSGGNWQPERQDVRYPVVRQVWCVHSRSLLHPEGGAIPRRLSLEP